MTRWKPDTCGCVIDVIDWDLVQGRTILTCPQHTGLSDDAHLAVVYKGENQVKNFALAEVAAAVPALFWTAADARARNEANLLTSLGTPSARSRQLVQGLSDEDLARVLDAEHLPHASVGQPLPGVTLQWRLIDGPPGQARTVEITCPQLTAQEKVAVATRHDTRFGSGKVRLT